MDRALSDNLRAVSVRKCVDVGQFRPVLKKYDALGGLAHRNQFSRMSED